MIYLEYAINLGVIIIIGTLISIILVDLKKLSKIDIVIISLTLLTVTIFNSILVIKNYNFYTKYTIFTVNLPTIILYFKFSKYNKLKDFFSYITMIIFVTIILTVSTTISTYIGFNFYINAIIELILYIPLSFAIKRWFLPLYRDIIKKFILLISWNRLFGILLFLVTVNIGFLYYYFMITPSNILYGKEIKEIIIITVIIALLFYILFICLFIRLEKQLVIENERKTIKLQEEMLKKQFKLEQKEYENTRILLHDLRHYVSNIRILLEENKVDKALELVKNFSDNIEKSNKKRYCNYQIINVVLNNFDNISKKNNINMIIRIYLNDELPVDEIDLAIMFSNALENAIHACQKLKDDEDKSIKIMCIAKEHLLIEIINSFNGDIKIDENGIPYSNKNGHGIGTKSIYLFVKKYDGNLKYQITEKKVNLNIIIPLN